MRAIRRRARRWCGRICRSSAIWSGAFRIGGGNTTISFNTAASACSRPSTASTPALAPLFLHTPSRSSSARYGAFCAMTAASMWRVPSRKTPAAWRKPGRRSCARRGMSRRWTRSARRWGLRARTCCSPSTRARACALWTPVWTRMGNCPLGRRWARTAWRR